MIDSADIRFFQTLKTVCSQTEGVDKTCQQAIQRALETGDPQDLRAARQTLDLLDGPLKDHLLQQVHRLMATDLSAIWDAMSHASDPRMQRPN